MNRFRPARIDLHLHTDASDGGLSPLALVKSAATAALDLIAITDHDTAAGARSAPASWGNCRVMPGIEISSTFDGADLHILGYAIDPEHPAIRGHEEGAVRQREARMLEMIRKLGDIGIHVRFEDVLKAAGEEGVLGRPHLARVLQAGGHVPNIAEAFNRWIGDRGTCFAPIDFLTPEQAVARIHEAGGIAVWAHPPLELVPQQLRRFADAGLDGLEVFRPKTSPADLQLLEGYAEEYGLLVTGGSDWHGAWSAKLGEFFVKPQDVEVFLERLGDRVGAADA